MRRKNSKLETALLMTAFLVSGVGFLTPFSWATPPQLPTFPPLVFNPPKPERFVLPNGLTVFLLEDHELPLIHVALMVKGGSQYDLPGKIGLGALLGPVMTSGGSEAHTPDEILRSLDITGGSLGFSVNVEEASGAMNCRAKDFDTVFGLFTELLLTPRFQRSYLGLEKEKAQEALRRMNDEPEEISRREFRKAVYGAAHPYARTPTPQTIDDIGRSDLIEAHQRFFKPNKAMLAVSGDFKSAEMKQKLTAMLAKWASAEVTFPPVPAVKPTKEKALFYVQRPINQSQIRIGHTGLARHDPDHFAWEVFNELWGGGGTSRLFQTVRTEKGLAYAVGSAFSEPTDLGLIVAICQTRGPETPEAIRSILAIDHDVQLAPFTPQELNFAKEAIRNRFVENFTSSAQIAQEMMAQEFHGFPSNYLETYTDKIGKVTQADLKRAAEKHLHPDQSVILVVGDLSTFNKPLSTIGRPQEIRLPDYRLESMQP